jgi:hypothetical protein
MKSQTVYDAKGMHWKSIILIFVCQLVLIFNAPVFAQNCPITTAVRTICKQIGNAEVVSVSSPFGAYPKSQPVVYWHDDEWKIDMLPNLTSDGELSMKITPHNGSMKIVNFDAVLFVQVDSITRNQGDGVIVIGEPNGMSSVFSIVDLKLGKIMAGGLLYEPSISPDRRFLLYKNWYLPHVGGENQYVLYDTLKTLEENTCGYGENNPEYKRKSDQIGITQVYPYQANCLEEEGDTDDNNGISNFIWSSDSSKVVFADVKSGIISLILVKMPHDDSDKNLDRDKEHEGDRDRGRDRYNDRPQTLTYKFVGTQNVCAGAATCDSNNVHSIAWNGDSVNVSLVQANSTGPAIVKNLTIPLSKFVPLAK